MQHDQYVLSIISDIIDVRLSIKRMAPYCDVFKILMHFEYRETSNKARPVIRPALKLLKKE